MKYLPLKCGVTEVQKAIFVKEVAVQHLYWCYLHLQGTWKVSGCWWRWTTHIDLRHASTEGKIFDYFFLPLPISFPHLLYIHTTYWLSRRTYLNLWKSAAHLTAWLRHLDITSLKHKLLGENSTDLPAITVHFIAELISNALQRNWRLNKLPVALICGSFTDYSFFEL